FLKRKRILFVCKENACRSQMASAFARYHAGDRIEAESAGSAPAEKIDPLMEEVMRENGIDMAFRKPKSIKEAARGGKPDLIISMGCEEVSPLFSGVPSQEWPVPETAGKPIAFMARIRGEIEERVRRLIE
ncbi:MAG TPA: flavin reductase, partial [Desulfobacterales bacterium]|nr:flavin reductase [Desulfobacterales bacterium]